MACLLCGARDVDLCVNETWAGTWHAACTHGACLPCVRNYVNQCLPQCRAAGFIRVQCYQPGCRKAMPQKLVLSASVAAQVLADAIDKDKREMFELVPCSKCKHICNPLVSRCGHGYCENCWDDWAQHEFPISQARARLRVKCLNPQCHEALHADHWRKILAPSKAVCACADMADAADAELKRLKNVKDLEQFMQVTASLTEAGPICSECKEHRFALLSNQCGHTACEKCWIRWCEEQSERCRSKGAIAVSCFGKKCSAGVSPCLWADVCAQSPVVKGFHDHVSTEMKRLQGFTTVTRLASQPSDGGPVCPVCFEPRLGLLNNQDRSAAEKEPSCHAACEDCWAQWAEEHINQSCFERALTMRCIGQKCTVAAAPGVWAHSCTRSSRVQDLENLFKRRRQLQSNQLFPADMQIDCPQPLCVGLGYLGYETVMCFICEHQWSPEDPGEAVPDVDVEVVMGVKVKRCPKCSQYIEKNGGCDHMTCRHRGCGHEFWWSTLKPYRSGGG